LTPATASGARVIHLQKLLTLPPPPQPSRYDNLPRKRAKFINFAKSALDIEAEIAESLWSLIEAPATDMPIPAVTEEPVAVTEEPELVAHQAPPTSCGLVRFLKRRIGFRGVGRTRFVQTPPGLKEPMGGGLDGWLAGLDAEDPAKQALRFPVNLPLPANLSPPRRSSPSRLPLKGAQPAKQSTKSSQVTSPPAPLMRRPSTDANAALRAAPPTSGPNLAHLEITLFKPAHFRQETPWQCPASACVPPCVRHAWRLWVARALKETLSTGGPLYMLSRFPFGCSSQPPPEPLIPLPFSFP
jgi:hypothetical protein